MTRPRLGVSIIIDNVSTPGSEADVSALKDTYDTAGVRSLCVQGL